MTFDASLAEMSPQNSSPRFSSTTLALRLWWRTFHFGKGLSGFGGVPGRGRLAIRLCRRGRRQGWGRRWRGRPGRVLDRDLPGSQRGRRFRRGCARPRAQLFGLGAGHLRPASWTHPRRSNRQHRARADQPARARSLRGRAARVDGRRFSRVENSGVRPTFDNGNPCSRFIFLISMTTSTGAKWREFIERIRGEHKFDSFLLARRRDETGRGAGPRHSRRQALRRGFGELR